MQVPEGIVVRALRHKAASLSALSGQLAQRPSKDLAIKVSEATMSLQQSINHYLYICGRLHEEAGQREMPAFPEEIADDRGSGGQRQDG